MFLKHNFPKQNASLFKYLVTLLEQTWKMVSDICSAYHVNAWFRAFTHWRMKTTFAEAACVGTPSTLVFHITSYTQRTVWMLPMGSQDITFVQHNINCVNMVISVPNNCHTGFIFTSIGFVRVLWKTNNSVTFIMKSFHNNGDDDDINNNNNHHHCYYNHYCHHHHHHWCPSYNHEHNDMTMMITIMLTIQFTSLFTFLLNNQTANYRMSTNT